MLVEAGPVKIELGGIFRFFTGWLIGVCVTYVIGSVAQSLFVLRELSSIGTDLPAQILVKVVLHDLRHLAFGGKYISYGTNIAIGLLIAFPCADVVARILKMPLVLVAAVAGAVAIVTMILVVDANSPSTLFAGTRGWYGMLAQIFAGIIGGAAFAMILAPRKSLPEGAT